MKFCSDFPDGKLLFGQGDDAGLCRFALPLVYLPAMMPQPGPHGFGLDAGGDGGGADRRLGRHAGGLVAGDKIGDGL